jgi:hypothetical protein
MRPEGIKKFVSEPEDFSGQMENTLFFSFLNFLALF